MNGRYLRNLCLCTFLTLLIISTLLFASCKKDGKTDTEDTTPTDEIDDKLTSENGDIQFYVLGLDALDEFDGKKAADGNKIYVAYFEAVNKSRRLMYVHGDFFSYRFEDTQIEIENYPEGYRYPDGLIASGKRIKYCIAFEGNESWKCLSFTYYPDYLEYAPYAQKSFDVFRADVANGISDGNTEYPIDNADYSSFTESFVESVRDMAFGNQVNVEYGMNLLNALEEDENGLYCWPYIDYNVSAPTNHLYTLRAMCQALGKEGIAKLSDEDVNKINSAIRKWLAGDYELQFVMEEQTVNGKTELVEVNRGRYWCENQVSYPAHFFAAIAMLGDRFDTSIYEEIFEDHPHTVFPIQDIYYRGYLGGSNLIWVLINSIWYAAQQKNIGYAYMCYDTFCSDIHILDDKYIHGHGGENCDGGIASDGSFWDHCTAYLYGYGARFNELAADMIGTMAPSGYEFPPEKLEILSYYITKDYLLTSHGNLGNMFAGRVACTGTGLQNPLDSELYGLAKTLLSFDKLPNREKIEYIVSNMEGAAATQYEVNYFTDTMASAMKTENAAMYARGAKNGICTVEGGVEIHCMLKYMVYGGLTEFLSYDTEYAQIGKIWDWCLVPGTTAFRESDEEVFQWTKEYNVSMMQSFSYKSAEYVGGDSDDKAAAVYVGIETEGNLSALKTDISYNGVMVCLGTDISCTAEEPTIYLKTDDEVPMTIDYTEREVISSVDQCYNVDASYNGKTIGAEPIEITDGTPVKNSAFAYYNLCGGKMLAKVETRTGCLARIFPISNVYNEESGDVFAVWFSHGVNPQGESYAYAVVDNGKGDAPENADGLGITVLENSNDIQAVEFADGTAVAVFHDTSKSLTLTDGRTISAENEENRVVIVH